MCWLSSRMFCAWAGWRHGRSGSSRLAGYRTNTNGPTFRTAVQVGQAADPPSAERDGRRWSDGSSSRLPAEVGPLTGAHRYGGRTHHWHCLGLFPEGVRQKCRSFWVMAGQSEVLRCSATLRSGPHGQVSMSAPVRGHIGASARPVVQRGDRGRVVVCVQHTLGRGSRRVVSPRSARAAPCGRSAGATATLSIPPGIWGQARRGPGGAPWPSPAPRIRCFVVGQQHPDAPTRSLIRWLPAAARHRQPCARVLPWTVAVRRKTPAPDSASRVPPSATSISAARPGRFLNCPAPPVRGRRRCRSTAALRHPVGAAQPDGAVPASRCRSTLVVASRTTQPRAAWTSGGRESRAKPTVIGVARAGLTLP
jgi:hypothetical protein